MPDIKNMKNVFQKGKSILFSQQSSVFSAATLIMFMIIASRILGVVRQRVLANLFVPADLSLFFAAFRLPDLIFEIVVYGTFSSAFVPVFTKLLHKDAAHKEAWETASKVVNIGLVIFGVLALIFSLAADPLYSLVAPGFTDEQTVKIASLARILFAAQAIFVVSYVMTAILESLQRFFVPALAPVFYNVGIILGTIVLAPSIGLYAPAVGVVIGAIMHLAIQLPLARKLGFRFRTKMSFDPNVKHIGKLAAPRLVDLSFEQVAKSAELYFASLISAASYTYFTFANTLALFPVGLIGTSLAKAALPTLARQDENIKAFRQTLFSTLSLIVFLVMPMATILIVLRIPIVRLVYGTGVFDWEATVQTGMVLSVFAASILFQSVTGLMERAFYALHDTKTPVAVSIFVLLLSVVCNWILVGVMHLPVWAIAASFTVSIVIQSSILLLILSRRLKGYSSTLALLIPVAKSILAAVISGTIMYILLKVFDRAAWVRRLSFIPHIDSNVDFERFVLDTRYTFNLIILSGIVIGVGIIVYIGVSFVLRSSELALMLHYFRKVIAGNKLPFLHKKSLSEPETINLP